MQKKYREDLNRHIPQKINEFASLALVGRYPSSSTGVQLGINRRMQIYSYAKVFLRMFLIFE